MKLRNCIPAAVAALAPTAAWAHAGHDGAGGFLAGMAHPLTGIDHLAAMLLIGLWAGLIAPKSKWALSLPVAFLAAMLIGFATSAVIGAAMVEPLIAASLIVLGLAAALAVRAPIAIAVSVATLFGFAHGMAHGFETPQGSFPALFAAGFLIATGGLHAAGLWLAKVLPAPLMRLVGMGSAGLGLVLAGAG